MTTENDKVLQLPILKHFSTSDMALAPGRWRRGEKGIGAAIGLVLGGTLAWGLYGYVLPVVFGWAGQALGTATAAALAIALFFLLPVFAKAVKRLSRALHKALIRYDPFGELEAQKEKMIASRSLFKAAKAQIKAIQLGMEREAVKTKNEARTYREKVQVLQAHAQNTRHHMRQPEGQLGEGAADTDAYVDLQTNLMKTLGEGQRPTCAKRPKRVMSGRTCTTACRFSKFRCRPCATAGKTSARWRSFSADTTRVKSTSGWRA